MTTESKKSPAPEQASEATRSAETAAVGAVTAKAIVEQHDSPINGTRSKFRGEKSGADALTDEQIDAAWERLNGATRVSRFWFRDAVRAILATSPVEQPAAAPADERTTTFDEWLERYVTETGGRVFPPDALRACWQASAAAAKETGAEGATDLRERARLAADQWANPGTSIPQRTAYRDGFIDGASSPAIAAQAVAAWLHRDDPRDCISDAKKRDMIEHAGSGGRRLAENYSIGLCRLDALPAMAAAAPADERATWSNARDSLAVAMAGFAGRFEAAWKPADIRHRSGRHGVRQT
ncbi:hypothetical protein [Burkholderia ubonensis]|uniref:hypothetical protein n=1 Tax=Burkholderia ubonensis TaxID=101571 RepID=UPI000A831DB4|nr:hypothetical protein [Burkholderia ubonensis]